MSTRLRRVEQLLQREIAAVIVQGELRDPRLAASAAISVTGVDVSPDLSHARVFIDVVGEHPPLADVLAALRAAAGAMRALVSRRIRLKRVPALRFVRDESIERGAAIERVLAEIHAQSSPPSVVEAEPGEEPEPEPEP